MKPFFRPEDPSKRIAYKVRVYGEIGEMWFEEIDGKNITFDNEVTTIHVTVDQTALRGFLGRLWDLNLTLLSVTGEETEVDPKMRRQNG
jgi:hypothetical protein